MLEKEKGIDAVIVGTPDHSHAAVAMAAIALKKGVYVAKPMTRTVFEARALAKAAREQRVATQMSVQSTSTDPAVTTEEWVKSGVIGKVHEVLVWTDRPVWPQGLVRPADKANTPRSLDWDLWWDPRPCGRTTPCTIRSTSAAGTISAPAAWATWRATHSTSS